jgi:putative membrane protein
MVTWFAGLFYLPRLFVYHSQNPGKETVALFKIMERRLLMMTHIGGILTVIFGVWMLLLNWDGYMSQGWMHFKLLFVVALIGYHFWCYKLVQTFKADQNRHDEKWYRWFNEAPSILLMLVVILVVVRPF